MRQVLVNLVGNALKFTEAGEVEVRYHPPADAENIWFFFVRDTGIGIDDEARERLFDPFSQAGVSTTRQYGGTGLGLAICRRLVEAMGGEMDFESILGTGSAFWFTVPLRPGDARAVERRKLPLGDPFEPVTRPLHVLIAEDNEINQVLVSKMLKRMGHHPSCVDDGSEALTAVRQGGYDAVLMDVQMPVMDGLEATRRIRALAGPQAKIPVIALTADAQPEQHRRIREAGVDEVLTKPLDPGMLRMALDRV